MNINGKVILYGDEITDAMQYLLDETNYRRELQAIYNKKNNIKPKTIYKSLDEIKLTTAVADESKESNIEEVTIIDDSTLEGIEIKDKVDTLKRKMLKFAKDLQFEEAALLRDKIDKIEKAVSS